MTRTIVIAALVALLATVLWWFFLFSPAGEQLAALELESDDLRNQQSQLRNQIAQLEDIRDREVEIRADLSRLQELIPTNPSQASLVRQIQLAADASGVVINSLTYEDPEIIPGAPPVGADGFVLGGIRSSTVVQGGYFQIVDFLRRLEVEVPRAFLVTAVNVEEGEDSFPQLEASVDALLYAYVTPLVDPNAAPPPPPAEGAEDADGEAGEETPDGEAIETSMLGTREVAA